MITETCGNCRFFQQYHNSNLGICKRFPPTAIRWESKRGEVGPEVQGSEPIGHFLKIANHEWCGEWKKVTPRDLRQRKARE